MRIIHQYLPVTAKLMLVGDATPFYWMCPIEYHTVFNPSPLAEMVNSGKSPAEIVEWMRSRKIAFVYVNWMEMRRLRATYGFWPEITAGLFNRMEEHGLEFIQSFRGNRYSEPYATLYRVKPPNSPDFPLLLPEY
jgi:hypothetical protein